MTTDLAATAPRTQALQTWAAHAAVWLLAGLSARLSRTGAQLEAHITGRDGAELAPEHLRHILTAPTTEFKAISAIGVVAAVILSALLWRQGSRVLRWVTPTVALVCLLIYLAGYGVG